MNGTASQLQSLQQHSQSRRTVAEIFVHAAFVNIATIIAARHLAALRRQSRSVSSYQVFATILIPTFALADLSIATYRTIRSWQRTGWQNATRYYICAALDMRAVSTAENDHELRKKAHEAGVDLADNDLDEVAVPLHLIPYQNVKSQRVPYDTKWFAQMAALVTFGCYAMLIDILWIRRAQHNARTYIDDYTALTALTGTVITFVSASIMILNTVWRAPRIYASKFQLHCIEPSTTDLFLNLAWQTVLVELQASLLAAICFQSLIFLTLRGDIFQEIHHSAACRTTRVKGVRYLLEKNLTSSSTMEPRPCCPWSENGLTNVQSSFAEVGIFLAYCCALIPLYYIIAVLLKFLSPQGSKMQRMGHNLLWGKYMLINSNGVIYVMFNCALLGITIWDVTTARSWELWMWTDPWCDMFWRLV